MPSQWVIRRNGEGCDVLWREELDPMERHAIVSGCLAEGMSSLEAQVELRLTEAGFTRCNKTKVFSHAACVEYVLSLAKPGDVLVDHGVLLVYMEPASA